MRSGAMRRLDRAIRTVADKDVTVSLTGESGTGKEVLARRVHELSHRRAGPFIPINCAAIPETLFESELFGHEKGAFTGATERTRGKIEAASGGTLFLDEVGETPLGVQAKLLRFLESRKFMRVGSSTKIAVDVRLVTATLRPLETEVREGRFRADLFYRIQGITLAVPPLRERQADIDPLVQQFVAEMSARHGTRPPRLTRAALAAFREHAWPGNVRELRNAVELVCVMREAKRVRVQDLPEAMRLSHALRLSSLPTSATAAGRQSGALEVRLDRPLQESVDAILAAALSLEGGNRSRAAQRLSVSLRTMQRFAARAARSAG
ncbi:MAG: sigma-54 dependent transcriptional regulator [Myxococcales bacterium]|nr:sigma-54-dependent Fis family transcriptional regulator [Sorangiineae bacterium PRO1]MCL4753212.1 sigma-54 dependent transcriptional regulator [Myxococcales bacterium]